MKINTKLFDQLKFENFVKDDEFLMDVENRLDKNSYDVFVYSCEGHKIAVKNPNSVSEEGNRETFYLFNVDSTKELRDDWIYDMPEFFTVKFNEDTKAFIENKIKLLLENDFTDGSLPFQGASFDHVAFEEDDDQGDSPAIGDGRFHIEGSGCTFRIEYFNDANEYGFDFVQSDYLGALSNLDHDDIFGELMIPRLIAWGTKEDLQLALECLDLEGAFVDSAINSVTAIVARITRHDEVDSAVKWLIQQDSAQHLIPGLIEQVEGLLPADVIAELNRIHLQNKQAINASARKRTL